MVRPPINRTNYRQVSEINLKMSYLCNSEMQPTVTFKPKVVEVLRRRSLLIFIQERPSPASSGVGSQRDAALRFSLPES